MKIAIVDGKPFSVDENYNMKQILEDGVYDVNKTKSNIRTIKQNSALHKWCDLISTHLNDSGFYINTVLKAETVWSMEKVKENIFKPVVASLYDKKSTTKLNKDEFEKIIDTITLAFANKGIVVPSFPNKEMLCR